MLRTERFAWEDSDMRKMIHKTRLSLVIVAGLGLAACAQVPNDSPFKNGDIYGYEPPASHNVRAISEGELHFDY